MKISVADLTFRYKRSHSTVISDLSYKFAESHTTAVTGRSGSGKSTLLYLLGLLLTPSSGQILLGESDPSKYSDSARSAVRGTHVGIVFQDALLDPSRTVLDNVLEGCLYSESEQKVQDKEYAMELLERFGVLNRADHRPGQVSGGQAQRIALCRTLIKRPSVVLADEPTGNLDADSAAVVRDALHDAAQTMGSTVVIASHDMAVVQSCDFVLEL